MKKSTDKKDSDDQPKFDEAYLDELIARASKNWKRIDVDEFLREYRGDYEA